MIEEINGSDNNELEQRLAEALPFIDERLAAAGLAINQRPTHAAIEFVDHFVDAVREGESSAIRPGEFGSYLATKWFAAIYAWVDKWYRIRFPAAFEQKPDHSLKGAVMIAGTTFGLRVPRNTFRSSEKPDCIWIGFPDGVCDEENYMTWIVNPPNLAHLTPAQQNEAQDNARLVAGRLRFISSGLTSATRSDAILDGFKAGILPRLANAANLLISGSSEEVQQSFWEMQLACESALKGLQQQRTKAFKPTHDLFVLYDGLVPHPEFNRDMLKRLPRWEDASNLRYGQGDKRSRADATKAFEAALMIVAGAVASMERVGLGNAQFEITKPLWTKAFDN
jgi:hypothetical protein